jgi:hypothetical protein
MKKKDFKNMEPNMFEIVGAFNNWHGEESHKSIDQISFNKGVFWVLRFLEDKFSDFTENEELAIEEYKTNKISAVKFLMSESNYGLKQAKDFLDKHSNLSVPTHEA